MDSVVPPEVTAELTQILSNLVLGDNQVRANAEKAVNERLDRTPELYLLALAQFATSADTEVMRSFSLVLLRRLLFRTAPSTRLALYDHLSAQSSATLERILLHSLLTEPSPVVRRKTVDTVCDLAHNAMARGRPWHTLQMQAFSMTESPDTTTREAAYRVFAGCPDLIADLQPDPVLAVLRRGLEDPASVDVRLAALRASVVYLSKADPAQQAHVLGLLYPMLNTLPALPQARLPDFLAALTPLASAAPALFEPHLRVLLAFLPALIMPPVDAGPTPTVARPNPGPSASTFVFPPPAPANGKGKAPEEREADDEQDEVRKAALEFMVSLSEARPPMVRRVDGWTAVVVRGCLEGMAEIPEDETEIWLEADPADDPTDDTYPHVYEQAIDRLACALAGKAVLPPAFQHIPAMLASHDWRQRHAGLMAIAAIAEGTNKIMQHELGKVVELVTPMFADPHPRVRYAACQCIGQLCTDLEEVIQEQFHRQIFAALIPTLEAPEARVHAHAAAALINFCEGVERETLIPYLDPIVERLLKLLHPIDGKAPKRYVQEQVVTSLAMVADASEATFAKHYSSIMPLLLNVLRNANSPEYGKLRVKAMECAGLIAIAVGRDVFRPDSQTLIELLMHIQNTPADPSDTMLGHYLIATWAKVCQALGPEFEPYLPVVMPPLLAAASAKADIDLYDEDNLPADREGWEILNMEGQHVGIRTSALEEKCQAFETLVIYSSTLGAHFAPYLPQSLEIVLPNLRFYFHEGVREACAMVIPMLVSCGKSSGTLTDQMVLATFSQLINCINEETDASFLASLFKCFTDAMRPLGGPFSLDEEIRYSAVEAAKAQLERIANKRKARAARPAVEVADEREDLMLIEEMEDFALEDMARLLMEFDRNHPLLMAVPAVRDLGLHLGQWDSEDEGGADG